MNRRLLSLWVVFISALSASGQNQANYWYFGNHAGINFNPTTAIATGDGALVSVEGSASMCSADGRLLFYTNGETIWAANHLPMPRGKNLKGSNGSTQSSLIIPRPKNKGSYYVFTLKDWGGTDGLRYNEVNMALNSGLGDVTNITNVLIRQSVAEKLTATRHSNGTDYWVLVHGADNAKFYAYKVSENGPATNAIISDIGASHSGELNNRLGWMKFSPDGKKVACAVFGSASLVEVFDFNSDSGTVSNMMHIDYSESPYGIEFSPDSKRLYVSAGSNIYQYTLPETRNNAQLLFTQKQIPSSDGNGVWALQLAPDGKIYVCKKGNSLGVINFPNNEASFAGFIDNSFPLYSGTNAVQGLPNFLSNYLADSYIEAENTCASQSTRFHLLLNDLDSVHWNFGDINAGAGNTAKGFTPEFTYSHMGVYTVSATLFINGASYTTTRKLQINPLPSFSLGNDTTLCKGQALNVQLSVPGASFMWNNGSQSGFRSLTTPGIHFVEVTLEGCKASDSVKIVYDIVNPDFGINKSIQCQAGNKFEFTANGSGIKTHTWLISGTPAGNTGKIQTSFGTAGTFPVSHAVISINNCTDTLLKEVKVFKNVKADFDIKISDNCGPGNSFEFTDKTQYTGIYTAEYEIENRKIAKNDLSWNFSKPGIYTVKFKAISAEGCSDVAEKQVTVFEAPNADFTITVQNPCSLNNAFVVHKTSPLKSYETLKWMAGSPIINGGPETTISISTPGKHTIKAEVTNTSGCKVVFEQEVEVFGSPVVDFTTTLNRTTCLGNKSVEFVNTTNALSPIASYLWNFGDNTTSKLAQPVKDFASESNYNVSLTATDSKGCIATVTKTISTYERPDAKITSTVNSACKNNNAFTVSFKNYNPAATILQYYWQDASGRTYNANPLPISFDAVGEHVLKLIVTGKNGCVDSGFTSFKVLKNPAGQIAINKPEQCLEGNVFNLEATITNGTVINTYAWDLGNGNRANTALVSQKYTIAGKYDIGLEVTDQNGCKAVFEPKQVIVHSSPIFQVRPVDVCDKQPARLRVSGLSTGIPVTQWQWDLGDGSNASLPQPTHTYPHSGTFSVTAKATTDKGCSYITTTQVNVHELPMPDFSNQKTQWGFDETVIEFTAKSQAGISDYRWEFGNGKTGTNAVEKVKYDKAGYYNVSLQVTNTNGCSNTIKKQILVVPPFDAYVPTSFTPNGDGKNDEFGMEGVQFIKTFDMQIVNRWGQIIFESRDLNLRWDGKSHGEPMPPDIYSYVIILTDAEDRPYTLSGTIQLLR